MFPIAGVPAVLTQVCFFLLGLVFGSFGNVLIYRLPRGQSIWGRSRCPRCKKSIEPLCLIPVVSFLCLRGKCKHCKKRISWQYPGVELVSGLLAVAATFIASSLLSAVVLAFALWMLFLIAVVDVRIQSIPDAFTILFIILAFLYTGLSGAFDILAFMIGVGFFGAQWVLSRGKWIGSGDVLLAVGLSALLGQRELVLFMLFSSYILGALVASVLLFTGRITRKDYIAFGPFLALGTLTALLMGERMMSCLLWSARSCVGIPFLS